MKLTTSLLTIAITSLAWIAIAVDHPAHATEMPDQSTEAAVKVAVETFARGESSQSVDVLETVLNPSFAMTAVMNGKVITFSRDDFLAGIAAKKFGGNQNPLSIDQLAIDGHTAAVEMRLEGPTVRFHHFATLAFTDDSWTLVHSLVTMEAKPAP